MFARFLLVGILGFLVDSALTLTLIAFSFDAALARIPAIVVAMLVTWLANRCFTYQASNPISCVEPLRYAMVATLVSVVNYVIYLVLITFGIWTALAIALATACQAIVSFHAYRSFVFPQHVRSIRK